MKSPPFPETVCAFYADVDGSAAYSTPLNGRARIDESVAVYAKNELVKEIRVATYQLVGVETVYTTEGGT